MDDFWLLMFLLIPLWFSRGFSLIFVVNLMELNEFIPVMFAWILWYFEILNHLKEPDETQEPFVVPNRQFGFYCGIYYWVVSKPLEVSTLKVYPSEVSTLVVRPLEFLVPKFGPRKSRPSEFVPLKSRPSSSTLESLCPWSPASQESSEVGILAHGVSFSDSQSSIVQWFMLIARIRGLCLMESQSVRGPLELVRMVKV